MSLKAVTNMTRMSYGQCLAKARNKGGFLPSRITIELTNKCNLKCLMCPRSHMDVKYGFMKWSLFKSIIDQAADFGPIDVVPFFRGESLLHSDFFRCIGYIKKKKNMRIQLATNATLLDKRTADKILDCGIDFISFSLDSCKKDEYEKIRRDSSYSEVTVNVDNFLSMRRMRRLRLPEVQVSIVKTQDNRHLVKEFVRNWIGRVERVRVYYEHSRMGLGRFGKLILDKDRIRERMSCFKPLTDIVFYWDGIVALCNHDWNAQGGLGKVDRFTIREIWNSEIYNKIREMHYKNTVYRRPCRYCDQWMCYYLPEGIIGELYCNPERKNRG